MSITPEQRLQELRGSESEPAFVASQYNKRFRVAVIGSGNWGTAVAKIVAENCMQKPYLFHRDVKMWVRSNEISDMKMPDIINTYHENIKYLPGVTLPFNLFAYPDIREVVKDADILIINLPHQFLGSVCDQLKGIDFSKSVAISCLKGINVSAQGVHLLHEVIEDKLGLHCGVLSGANIASEVGRERFSETTVAFPQPKWYEEGDADEQLIKELFQRPYFHVQVSDDVCGVSVSGALKNVVAIGAGLIEGVGWGENAKTAVMRRGLLEMIKFGDVFFKDKCRMETFTTESAGVADLITSCSGGRNARVGRAFARTGKPIHEVEKELLDGQSAQGLVTGAEVIELLEASGKLDEFPLLVAIHDIVNNKLHVSELPSRIAE